MKRYSPIKGGAVIASGPLDIVDVCADDMLLEACEVLIVLE